MLDVLRWTNVEVLIMKEALSEYIEELKIKQEYCRMTGDDETATRCIDVRVTAQQMLKQMEQAIFTSMRYFLGI